MSSQETGALSYDRELLLLGPKRNAVLDVWEVLRYGNDSYGDANYVSIYGLAPADWYAKGIRLLGRTAVECTRDRLADAMGKDIAATANSGSPQPGVMVMDPFAGSGNTLYWILRHLPGAEGLGFELDREVFRLTKRNLSILRLPLKIVHADYATAVRELSLPADHLLVAFVAPPWGDALSTQHGLDLRRTAPPVSQIVDLIAQRFSNRSLFAIQVYERIDADSLDELTPLFDWSALRIYDFNPPGQNHGLLLATRGWRP